MVYWSNEQRWIWQQLFTGNWRLSPTTYRYHVDGPRKRDYGISKPGIPNFILSFYGSIWQMDSWVCQLEKDMFYPRVWGMSSKANLKHNTRQRQTKHQRVLAFFGSILTANVLQSCKTPLRKEVTDLLLVVSITDASFFGCRTLDYHPFRNSKIWNKTGFPLRCPFTLILFVHHLFLLGPEPLTMTLQGSPDLGFLGRVGGPFWTLTTRSLPGSKFKLRPCLKPSNPESL